MRLQAYLDATGASPKDIAKKIGVTDMAVRHWLSGSRVPRPAMLRRIAEVTGGQVQPSDFIDAAPSAAE